MKESIPLQEISYLTKIFDNTAYLNRFIYVGKTIVYNNVIEMVSSKIYGKNYGGGHCLKEGELKDNSSADFFACLAHSLFEGKHSATYKFGFLKSLLDNLFSS